MSAPMHTPGPWSLIHFGGPQIGHEPTGEAVCTMWGDESDPADPIHANAALIAAAPCLLEALEDAIEIMDDQLCGDFPESLAHFRSVVARAKGGAA